MLKTPQATVEMTMMRETPRPSTSRKSTSLGHTNASQALSRRLNRASSETQDPSCKCEFPDQEETTARTASTLPIKKPKSSQSISRVP